MTKQERMKAIADMIGVNLDEVYYACTSGKADVRFMVKESGFYVKRNGQQEFNCANVGELLLQILLDKRFILDEAEHDERLRKHAVQKNSIRKYYEAYCDAEYAGQDNLILDLLSDLRRIEKENE